MNISPPLFLGTVNDVVLTMIAVGIIKEEI